MLSYPAAFIHEFDVGQGSVHERNLERLVPGVEVDENRQSQVSQGALDRAGLRQLRRIRGVGPADEYACCGIEPTGQTERTLSTHPATPVIPSGTRAAPR